MTHYFHHVPGRLRVKSPLLKGSERIARTVRDHMAQLSGVTSAEVSTVTGSVIVRYDASAVTAEALLHELHTLGIAGHTTPQHDAQVAQPRNGAGALFSERVADQVASRVVETLIERSAIALIGALI